MFFLSSLGPHLGLPGRTLPGHSGQCAAALQWREGLLIRCPGPLCSGHRAWDTCDVVLLFPCVPTCTRWTEALSCWASGGGVLDITEL